MSSRRWILKSVLALGGVALLGLAAYNFASVYYSQPIHLKLSGGNVCPIRRELATRICREVHESEIVLDSVSDTNSESIVSDVDSGTLDLGLVLGGFSSESYPHVRQVAILGVEPLHLLVRNELVQTEVSSLELLKGRRVSLGEEGSNGAVLAADLLRFAGMRQKRGDRDGDYTAVYTLEADLFKQFRMLRGASPSVRLVVEASLPDAIFLVDGMPSPLVDQLIRNGYTLVPLPYATALQLDNRRSHRPEGLRLEKSRVQSVMIPAFTYGIEPASPAQDCPTLGLRMLLVAHEDTPSTAIVKLLRALDAGAAKRYRIKLDTAIADSEFPPHPGAEKFAADRRPVSADEVLEPLGDLLSVIGTGIAGAFAMWGFLRGLRRVNPDNYLRQIDRIERLLQGSEQDENAPTMPLEFIKFLETRLAQIKQSAIEDYAHRRYQNDDALVSILTLIADTRHMLVQRRKQIVTQEGREVRMADAA